MREQIKTSEKTKLKQLRKPQPNKISFRTIYHSKKLNNPDEKLIHDFSEDYLNHSQIIGESLLEDNLIVLLEHEINVIEYLNQAVPRNIDGEFKPLSYIRYDGIREDWIPDFSVIWKHRKPMIIEVKPLAVINKERKKLFNKWKQAEEIAKKNNWDFYVFTDMYKSKSFRVENIIDLESQLVFATKECQEMVMKLFNTKEYNKNFRKYWTIEEIQNTLKSYKFSRGEILASVFYLIYNNKLFVDLDKIVNILTPIFNDKSLSLPLDKWLLKFDWENEQAQENFTLIDENYLSKEQFKRFNEAKEIVLSYKNGESPSQIMLKYGVSKQTIYNLWKKSEFGTNFNRLIRRKGSGRPNKSLFIIDGDQKITYLDEQFKKTIEYYEKPEKPNKEECWNHFLHLKRVIAYNEGLIDSYRKSQQEIRKIINNLPEKNFFMRELNRYIENFKRRATVKREGFKKATKLFRNITGTTPYTNYIGQICEIDHTPSDVIGIVPLSIFYDIEQKKSGSRIKRQYMNRAVITTVMDLHTRTILGYGLRYRKPSIESTFLALRRTILGKINPLATEEEKSKMSSAEKILNTLGGMVQTQLLPVELYTQIKNEFDPIDGSAGLRLVADWWDEIKVMPRILHTDNGSDFQSKEIIKWGKKFKVKFYIRPVGGANYGGHIERLLKTLNKEAFHTLPGTTKGTIEERGDYKSEKKAILTFEQMETFFLLAILRYHVKVHQALGIPPMEAWNRAVNRGDNLTPFQTKKEIIHLAYNTLRTKIRKYNQNQGISINGIMYNYDSIINRDNSWALQFNQGDKIIVRYDPTDIRFVWWWNPKSNKPVRVWAT
ncbi:MAG: hypothetical protein EAX96_09920, partial [Candidatus Lokiarchaeota archaeon]|nr:hypothetical protein [Candidatus Lokiarchaeota archaeon]